jgi:hypothetical protein
MIQHTVLRRGRPKPCMIVQVECNRPSCAYVVYHLDPDAIPMHKVCQMDTSHDKPFAKLMTLRGHNQYVGKMATQPVPTVQSDEPFRYGRRLSNLEKNDIITLQRFLKHNHIGFLEQFGYAVNDTGKLVEATRDQVTSYHAKSKRWRSLSYMDTTFVETDENRSFTWDKRSSGIHEFSDIMKYTIDECFRRG